jgi:hypothetical protein
MLTFLTVLMNVFCQADKICFASLGKHFYHAGDLLHHTVEVFASWLFFTCVQVVTYRQRYDAADYAGPITC